MDYNKKSIRDIDVKGKKVLVRCDFNVPMDDQGNITDDKRITAAIPTIKYLLDNNAAVILMSHLGRPKGEFNEKYSLKPVALKLSQLLGFEVKIADDVIGESAKKLCGEVQPGRAVLLENVRFHKEEEKNDEQFAKALASLGDIYVNDAFGTAHRAHASTEGVSKFLPSVCGFLIEKEIKVMGEALSNPEHPFVAILGGAKVSDKIGVIRNLLDKCDTIIIGGAMAYTFAKSMGGNIGTSKVEDDKLELAKELTKEAKAKNVKLMLPLDTAVAKEFEDVRPEYADAGKIPDDMMGLDIGPKTIEAFSKEIRNAKTIVWNGPMGVFEFKNYETGTIAIAKAVSEADAVSIIGGGDSCAAVERSGFADKVTHISTGGGASLEFLEGKTLPGIACLENR